MSNILNRSFVKKIKFIVLAVVIAIQVNATPTEEPFTLTVSSDGELILQAAQIIDGRLINKLNAIGGEFVFTNTMNRYGTYTFTVLYVNKTTKKKGDITVRLFLKPGNTKLVFQGGAGKYKVTGASAAAQKDYQALIAKDGLYMKKISHYQASLREGSGNKKSAIKDSISKAVTARKQEVYESYILQHPNDDVSLYAMRIYSAINAENPQEVKSLLSKMGKELQETEEMVEVRKTAEYKEGFIKGVKAPDFTQADTSGNAITLSSLQGKYVLIDFWASWCHPCRAKNPSLIRLYNKYKDKGFTILGISLDSKKEAWTKAIRDDKLEWLNVSDLKSWKNAVAQQYQISSVPQGYLLDPQGVIIGINLDEEDLDQVLDQELIKTK